ncbi:uncharacterized protein LOC144493891 isoform X1 [Mustelus asterias]
MINIMFLLGTINLYMLIGGRISADLPRPILSLNPHFNVLLDGEKINLTCHCQVPAEMVRFYRSISMFSESEITKGFSARHLTFEALLGYEDFYTCECIVHRHGQWEYSIRSEPFEIRIRDKLLAPNISKHPSSGAIFIGEKVNISCQGEIRSKGGTFYLHRNNEKEAVQSINTPGYTKTVNFSINTEKKQAAGSYTCRYQTEVLGRTVHSPRSKALSITVKEKRLEPDMNSDPESGPQKEFPLHAVLGSAAALTLTLVIATVCFLLAKRRKSKRQNIDRCEISGSAMLNHETGDPLYVGQITPANPAGNRLHSVAPENNSQDVTYACLNLEPVRQKKGACATSPGIKLPAKKNHVDVPNSDNGNVIYASVAVGKLK